MAIQYDLDGLGGPEAFRTLPEGVKLTLLNGARGEVIGNPGDGGFVLVKWLEHPQEPAKVGEEEYVFFNEVKEAVG